MAQARHGEMSDPSDTARKFLVKVSASIACALATISVFDLVIYFTRNIALALLAGVAALSAAVWLWRRARRWRSQRLVTLALQREMERMTERVVNH
jgi:hypothetical protein